MNGKAAYYQARRREMERIIFIFLLLATAPIPLFTQEGKGSS